MAARVCVGVVGAGPAGIMAALEAAERGAAVSLFDTNEVVGRKLLVTGNGRCNISNIHARAERYACTDRSALQQALACCGHRETVARLREWGIPTYATADGWCYPLSESAATVAETLAEVLELAGVALRLKTHVSDLQPADGGVALTLGGGPHQERFDRVVLACGGKAYPALGSRGELFPALERLGHTVVALRPALAPLLADVRCFHKLQGVRLDVRLTLREGQRPLGQTVGNLMWTQSGFSGPAAMDLSHLVSARPGAALTLSIDLLADRRPALLEALKRWEGQPMPLAVALGSVLPPKVAPVLLPLAGLKADVRLHQVSPAERERLLRLLGGLAVEVRGTRGFDAAQLAAGGVPLAEVEPTTMASRRTPGLYLAGEVLDVVGPCGGYNLQWAWSSGALAGGGAAEAAS
ncbi:MAG: aminoacetone oxidase family FAD-binding enzyme [Chloroflexi bacterium]|nr:aminoacetone oxidase family FAD-binding enzyme [Chloroflexota bacterium]